MFSSLRQSIGSLAGMTLLTGVLYPLAVTGIGHALYHRQADGSLIATSSGRLLGSELLAQGTTDPKLFWSRPSAGSYQTLPSGASNLAPTSKSLQDNFSKQRGELEK